MDLGRLVAGTLSAALLVCVAIGCTEDQRRDEERARSDRWNRFVARKTSEYPYTYSHDELSAEFERLEQARERSAKLSQKLSQMRTSETRITQEEFGQAWPFTVQEGMLRCEPEVRGEYVLEVVTFRAGSKTYAVNGIAKSKRIDGNPKGKHAYQEIELIWKKDPQVPGDNITRKNMTPVLDKGLKLCQQN